MTCPTCDPDMPMLCLDCGREFHTKRTESELCTLLGCRICAGVRATDPRGWLDSLPPPPTPPRLGHAPGCMCTAHIDRMLSIAEVQAWSRANRETA